MTEPSSPTSQPYLNAWGTDPREVDPSYCPECEQINPRHYENCSEEGRARAHAALLVPFEHEWHTARWTGTTSCTRCLLIPLDTDDTETPCVPAWAKHLTTAEEKAIDALTPATERNDHAIRDTAR